MKLGSETGSLVNHLAARGTRGQPDPEVGMGATILHWTDRQAATIVEVRRYGTNMDGSTRWIVGVQEDDARIVKGSEMTGDAEYRFERQHTFPVHYWRFDGPKGWRGVARTKTKLGTVTRWRLTRGSGLKIGVRDHYRDPSF